MGVIYTDAEVVFQLLWGLPCSGSWPQFKVLLIITLPTATPIAPTPAAGNVPVAVIPSAFDTCVAHISAKAAQMIDKQILSGATSFSSSTGNINSITSLHKHHHNPDSIFCTMGGGMEEQAPWMKGKKKEKEKETTAAAVMTPPAPTSTTLLPVITVISTYQALRSNPYLISDLIHILSPSNISSSNLSTCLVWSTIHPNPQPALISFW
ncbi:uncharacterized protein BJ212DRAFT_1487458 [Suillus subaureus]|uniref:Uncharacterized protein n=1 Tax=Suillus subaureus TaxID=48587 RepID=A0A9P7DT36_9AGAM|nr:uncharacterized protein BJ212DRAFT_1487458 [Suillus subaureus]KAG1802324.1 hypothetical protein BJ212DRAFT_1487458 [Suillus subaureus]